jgi:hypothetical protein
MDFVPSVENVEVVAVRNWGSPKYDDDEPQSQLVEHTIVLSTYTDVDDREVLSIVAWQAIEPIRKLGTVILQPKKAR